MPILLGLEVAAGVAVASALNSDSISSRFGSISSRVTSAASQAASLARSLVGDESVASPSSEETGSPVRVNLRVRSLRLPRLFAPEGPCGVLCGIEMLEQLSNAVPRRFGDASGQWHLLFSTDRDGTSLSHMLRRTVGAGPCLLILKDVEARIYGAYCSSLGEAEGDPSVGGAHYGSGETFLFAVTRLQLPSPPAGSTPGSAASEGRARLGVWTYRWTHRNAHFIRSDAEGLFFGSGGAYGLALDASLLHGTSGPSETYGNSPLPLVAAPPTSGSFNSPRVQQLPHDAAQNAAVVHFECAALEVWGVDESTCRTLPACEGHVHVHAHCAPCAPGDAQTDT
uniref:Oxidation resistance protein 1 n=1 Tax=Calcidiscus leptoporus TaxID=127549 RepID=A0A7S0J196_9EUKA|mmetsp:Transcript_33958/g.79499  ORF Transcript_33958/g.79499 Transcript_33958/m.79499 type:complete len:340 (+) Transcript_33958:113-1132(+)